MFNISEHVSDRIGSVLFVKKDGQYHCSESWLEAYRLIFQSKAALEYIDIDGNYSTTRVDVSADAENHSIRVLVPAECGCDTRYLEIIYTLADGISAKEVPTELSEEIFVDDSNTGTTAAVVQVTAEEGSRIDVTSQIDYTAAGVSDVYLCQRGNKNYMAKLTAKTETVNGVTMTVSENGRISFSGTPEKAGTTFDIPFGAPMKVGANQYIRTFSNVARGDVSFVFVNMNKTWLASYPAVSTVYAASASNTLIKDAATGAQIYMPKTDSVEGIWMELMICDTDAAITYEQGNAVWWHQSFGQTVNAGSFNWLSGELTITDHPATVELTAHEVTALSGINYLSSTTGMTRVATESRKLFIGDVLQEQIDKIAPKMMEYVHIPRVCFYGETTGMSKDDAKIMSWHYYGAEDYINDPTGQGLRESGVEHTGYVKMKWQGTSSIKFPKKNFTIALYGDSACTTKAPVTLREKWGAQNKYCMKANFIDSTQCRNVVAAQLWGQVVQTRDQSSASYQQLAASPNFGAIDGYPILVFINDEYVGLYTMNIPKEDWMFGMTDGEGTNVVLCGEGGHASFFIEDAVIDESDWSYEVSPADKTGVVASLNRVVAAANMSEEGDDAIAAKKSALEACVGIDSVIDYCIFIEALGLTDNQAKNMIMLSYDGVMWLASAYDLDTAFGNHWSGAGYLSPITTDVYKLNVLLTSVTRLYSTEFNARKTQLLNGVLNPKNIVHMLFNFGIDIPQEAFRAEAEFWRNECGANANAMQQITSFVFARLG